MRNVEMARDYASRSEWCLREAKAALEEGNHPICIRRSQEALELATKAMLRYLAIEYPKEHDVGDALPVIEDKLPGYLKEKVLKFQKLLRELAEIRGPALYGFEREGIPASKAFNESRASTVFTGVNELVGLVLKFLRFE